MANIRRFINRFLWKHFHFAIRLEKIAKYHPTDKMLDIIRKIARAKKESKKACNQIAAYEIDQQIKKLTDELVALYEESDL